MSDLATFAVSDILELIGNNPVPWGAGLNVQCDGIDDECFGCVVSSDKTFQQFLQQHKGPYAFQPIEKFDGGVATIFLKRAPFNMAFAIDLEISEADCIVRNLGQPPIQYQRIDPATLPRDVEVQYMDPDRGYAINTQLATNHSAPLTNGKLSVPIDFVIASDQARGMAFDLLYRIWGQQPGLQFEHPDLRIEPGDILSVAASAATFTVLVQESTITKERTNIIKAVSFLTARGITIVGGSINTTDTTTDNDDYAGWVAAAG